MAKILVVEDDQLNRELLIEILSCEGHKVEVAVDGVDGMERIECLSPDVVITDLIMPNMTGLTLIRRVRERDKHLKIIALSGGGRDTRISLNDAQTAGADYVFAKPVAIDRLLHAVDELVSTG